LKFYYDNADQADDAEAENIKEANKAEEAAENKKREATNAKDPAGNEESNETTNDDIQKNKGWQLLNNKMDELAKKAEEKADKALKLAQQNQEDIVNNNANNAGGRDKNKAWGARMTCRCSINDEWKGFEKCLLPKEKDFDDEEEYTKHRDKLFQDKEKDQAKELLDKMSKNKEKEPQAQVHDESKKQDGWLRSPLQWSARHLSLHQKNKQDNKKEIIIQQDCIPDRQAFKANWNNMHNAAVVLMKLVDRIMLLADVENGNLQKLDADYSQYNDYGIIHMFSLYRQNKLMLLYVLVFLVLNPNTSEEKLLENFEDDEKTYTFLMDIEVQDFVALVPVIRLFFEVHKDDMCLRGRVHAHRVHAHIKLTGEKKEMKVDDFNNDRDRWSPEHECSGGENIKQCFKKKDGDNTLRCFWDTDEGMQSCLENMIDWFLKRSFLEQANETGFNVYTSANAYYFARENAKVKAEIEHKFDSQKEKQKKNISMRSMRSLKFEKTDGDGAAPFAGMNENISQQGQNTSIEIEEQPNEQPVQASTRWDNIKKPFITLKRMIRRTFFFTILLGFAEPDEKELKDTDTDAELFQQKLEENAEVDSSYERAFTCFVLQGGLYFGCLWLSNDEKACYEDTGFIGETFNNFMSIIIIYFSFLYLISISISEFYINTLSFIMESKSWQQQVDASKEDDNFICNSNSLSTFVLEYFVLSPYNNTYTPSYTIQIFCCRF